MENTASHPSGDLSPTRIFLAVFCFSLLLLALGPYANVSPTGSLDPWIYTGYFQNFDDMVARYGRAYYVARLPYIVVGIGIYHVFTPAVANWILNAVILTGILAPLYLIAARYYNRLVALVILVAGAGSTYVASTIAWDYPDGPAIAYAMLGLWMAVAAPARLPNRVAMLLTGGLWMMAGITNFICVFILLGFALTAVLWRSRDVKATISDMIWVSLGAALSLAAWCVVSKLMIDTWNILGPQWGQVRYASEHQEYLPNMWGRGNAWIPRTYRQLPTVVLTVLSGLLLFRPSLRTGRFGGPLGAAFAGLALAFACFAWLEFGLDKILLRVFYHSCYLVAPVLVVTLAIIGAVYRLPVMAKNQRLLTALLCTGLVLPTILRGYWNVPQTPVPWLGATVLGSFLLLLPANRLVLTAGLLALGALVNLGPALDPTVSAMTLRPKEALFLPDSSAKIIAGQAAYQLEVATDLQVLLRNSGMGSNAVHFWYDPDEPAKNLFDSLYSLYLWGYSDLSTEFKTKPLEQMRARIQPNGRVLHLSGDPARIAAHRQLMTDRGASWREIGAWNLGRRGQRYRIALDEVTFP